MATKKCDKPKSYHEGANEDKFYTLERLEEWLLNRVKRNKLKAGGL